MVLARNVCYTETTLLTQIIYAEAKVAMVGRWKVGPQKSLFDVISRTVGKIDIIAEDLGVITEDVTQIRKSTGAPGMAVLQFGFGSDSSNPHLPHNHEHNQVVYTGTHYNDTVKLLQAVGSLLMSSVFLVSWLVES
ncbi:hypothetical protein CRYUN_Cryun15aG0084100 [Craigia yunnanensis]